MGILAGNRCLPLRLDVLGCMAHCRAIRAAAKPGKAAQAKRTKEENREAARLGGKAAQAQRSAARSGAVIHWMNFTAAFCCSGEAFLKM